MKIYPFKKIQLSEFNVTTYNFNSKLNPFVFEYNNFFSNTISTNYKNNYKIYNRNFNHIMIIIS